MKYLITGLCALLLILWHHVKSPNESTSLVIGILQTASHPSLDAVREQFKQKLTDDLKGEVTFIEQNGMGQTSSLHLMMDALKRHSEVKLILTIATPATQIALLSEDKRAILYTAVTDPRVLGIEADAANACGISDAIDPDFIVKAIERFPLPHQTVAILYNPSESNSVASVHKLKEKMLASHFKVLLIGALSPSEMPAASQRGAREADLVLAPTDNLVAMTLPVIAEACQAAKKPLFGMDRVALLHGATAAVGIDYSQMGRLAASMALKILKGTSPQSLGCQALEPTLETL